MGYGLSVASSLQHDRVHPILTVRDRDVVAAFYLTAGWVDQTPPAWAAAGATTLVRQGCPLTLVSPDSPLSDGACTQSLVIVTMVPDLDALVTEFESAGLTITVADSVFGVYAEAIDPAGIRLHFLPERAPEP